MNQKHRPPDGQMRVDRFSNSGILGVRLAAAALSLLVSTLPTVAVDDARRRVIDEACPTHEREDTGTNGVMSPREVRCRLAMGATYDEIAAMIKDRQERQAARQRSLAEARQAARERAERARKAAMLAAPVICLRLVKDHKDGRWFASGATAPDLLLTRSDAGPDVDASIIAAVTARMDRLGHNYREPDQRAYLLTNPPMNEFTQFDNMLSAIYASIRARAERARDYEQFGRNNPTFVRPAPSAKDYAFACFMQEQFGSVSADPWDRRQGP